MINGLQHSNRVCQPAGRLLASKDALIKLGPTLAATAALLLTLKCSRSPLALPAVRPVCCIKVVSSWCKTRHALVACQALHGRA